ncbi:MULTISPECIES: SMC-Scp complex subunit ScpB [unclassified Micromonospora]|uniref:SMC-Scp complex subunit ScpB n=1 Tax=unclassified Micromonospora TaxID=2617518 RepID=UPI001C250174|nr:MULTISPECIES: SMC-Scp complex subunit ScpB [unclassified Micromonospora]MBU8860205.1 SMC-Scp complex subunit ScpB [Micromonospora sp. WMMB482]MDM4779738.1 SMC-Scp complex subunit ScpB [Micromonospora sp. b486]
MSDQERRDSLADQAAAWVPPWERPAPPRPAPDDSDATPGQPDPEIADTPVSRAADLDATPELPTDLGSEGPSEGPVPSKIATIGAGLGTGQPLQGRDRTKISGESGTRDAVSASGAETGTANDAGDRAATVAGDDAGQGVGATARDAAQEAGGGARAEGVPPKRGRRRAVPEPAPAPAMDDAELRGALEAILLVVDQPVSELVLAEVLEQAPERVGAMLDEIAAGYTAAGHGFELRRAAGGWRLYTRPEYATYVERFVLDGQSVRLTQAALETLAVVAYRQPVTRSRISAIRGVNCDGVLRTLVGRGLVEECGTEADSGAYLYRTTIMFLEKLGLNSVDDLPPLAPFLPDDVEELADATR